MIFAASPQGIIGVGGKIPWRYLGDWRRFKRITMGATRGRHAGRTTFESIGKPLPGRRNLVVTSRRLDVPEVERVRSVEEALAKAGDADVWFIGGARIYADSMKHVDVIDVTYVPDYVEELGRRLRARHRRGAFRGAVPILPHEDEPRPSSGACSREDARPERVPRPVPPPARAAAAHRRRAGGAQGSRGSERVEGPVASGRRRSATDERGGRYQRGGGARGELTRAARVGFVEALLKERLGGLGVSGNELAPHEGPPPPCTSFARAAPQRRTRTPSHAPRGRTRRSARARRSGPPVRASAWAADTVPGSRHRRPPTAGPPSSV